MRFSTLLKPVGFIASTLLALSSIASAENLLQTKSLNPCSTEDLNTGFTATLFNVVFTPANRSIAYQINAAVTLSGNVNATLEILIYGYSFQTEKIDPCSSSQLSTLCPVTPGPLVVNSNSLIPQSTVDNIPGIAYGIPDLDGVVKATINNATTGETLACVEANLSNGKTVNQLGVKWATAIIAGLALIVSAIMSGLGHSNTAAHISSNALSLFGFFQGQAIMGMTAIHFPPLAQSWLQDFEWSMGIINIGFMQTVLTWYQRSTGGTPSTVLTTLATYSVDVQKRGLDLASRSVEVAAREALNPTSVTREVVKRGASLVRRASPSSSLTIVKGIDRVGFIDGIEPTNIFLTGLGIFVSFVCAIAIGVALFKGFCELAAKAGWIKGDQFLDFRNGWKVILKGILFRVVLIGYAQMSILCLWELTVRDSAAEIVTAIFYFVAMTLALIWAAFKVYRLAQRSVHMHKNPAYILYSDPACLNKWGFLYVQYRATAYFFIFPQLAYILLKACFVAFGQGSGAAQAIGILIIETAWLIGVSIIRPWMDKKTNSFNISIAAINFISAICLLIFSDVFNQPEIVTGVLGVVFVLYNLVFAVVLLIMVIFAAVWAIFVKNPDTRYQPMRDDRGSFIKSQTNLNTELDALGATARGNNMTMRRDLDDDEDGGSFSTSQNSLQKQQVSATNVPLPNSSPASRTQTMTSGGYGDGGHVTSPPHSGTYYTQGNAPQGPPRQASPMGYQQGGYGGYNQGYSDNYARSEAPSYKPYNGGAPQQGGGNQWSRGVGYDP